MFFLIQNNNSLTKVLWSSVARVPRRGCTSLLYRFYSGGYSKGYKENGIHYLFNNCVLHIFSTGNMDFYRCKKNFEVLKLCHALSSRVDFFYLVIIWISVLSRPYKDTRSSNIFTKSPNVLTEIHKQCLDVFTNFHTHFQT